MAVAGASVRMSISDDHGRVEKMGRPDLLVLDGAHGEGGGQILRTSLSLSIMFRRPIRIGNIRKSRRNPGLAAQHLTAVQAAGRLCDARIRGDSLGSTELDFVPSRTAQAGNYHFDVGAARTDGSEPHPPSRRAWATASAAIRSTSASQPSTAR